MQIEMTIKGLMIDPVTSTPIVVLRDLEGQRVLPIWVGVFEANAIAVQIENVTLPRPMTHDLLRNVISDLHAEVERIVVNDLRDNTFFAIIQLIVQGERVTVDARPSDAIALALRARTTSLTTRANPSLRRRMATQSGSRSGSRTSTRTRWASTRCRQLCRLSIS
jgi:uncharacterized protein